MGIFLEVPLRYRSCGVERVDNGEREIQDPGVLAQVIVSKYADHLPLYQQSAIFAREGIDQDRSTSADWVGGLSALLDPLIESIGQHVAGRARRGCPPYLAQCEPDADIEVNGPALAGVGIVCHLRGVAIEILWRDFQLDS